MPCLMTVKAQPILSRADYTSLSGWATGGQKEALTAFRHSCSEIIGEGRGFLRSIEFGGLRSDWLDACAKALDAREPRPFFEEYFTPLKVSDPVRPSGLFTGYFEPEVCGSLKPGEGYEVPLYARPADLESFNDTTAARLGLHYGRVVDGKPQGYFTRREIEEGALKDRGLELVWLADWADAFFIHVQGSGRVRLPDGSLMRLAYAAKSGQPYTGIGGLLMERELLSREDVSMQAIRAWMESHPGEARQLMWENRSYVFFREVKISDSTLGPPGAQKVSLTPLTSLAVDRGIWAFGMPVWLDTVVPAGEPGETKPFRKLMIAQDAGTAIKGYARGDVFWGAGDKAAWIAGHMKSPGAMTVLLPNALAERLLSQQ